jgi:DNA-directed RNA polymerase subunit K/omega
MDSTLENSEQLNIDDDDDNENDAKSSVGSVSDDDLEDVGSDGVEGESDAEDVEGNDGDQGEDISKENPSALSSILSAPTDFDDEGDDEDEDYLQKFDKELTEKYIADTHPETLIHNYNEILALSNVVRDANNIIIDEFHKTIPMLTKYEKTRILGQRSKQLNQGANPFVPVSENILDTYIIAEMELKEKRLPFIIRRPIPNGSSEYWKLEDLELL